MKCPVKRRALFQKDMLDKCSVEVKATTQNIISSFLKEIKWNCLISEGCERRKNIQKKL